VDLINNDGMQGEPMSALLGPFDRGAAPECSFGGSIARSDRPGDELVIDGHVREIDGSPIAGALLDVWQTLPAGLDENQDPVRPTSTCATSSAPTACRRCSRMWCSAPRRRSRAI
jgi:catechol 1,2-dioxygenase